MSVTVGSSALGRACAAQDPVVAQALGPGRGDVVLGQRLDDRRAHHDRVLADQPERDRRDRAGRGAARSRPAGRAMTRRSPRRTASRTSGTSPSPVAKINRSAMPRRKYGVEYRRRDTRVADVVDRAAAFPARIGAEPEADHDRDDLAEAEQQQRRAEPLTEDLDDAAAAGHEREAQVALQRSTLTYATSWSGKSGLSRPHCAALGGKDLGRHVRVARRGPAPASPASSGTGRS